MTARRAVQTATAAAKAPPQNKPFSLISNEKLIELYTAMVHCRMIAESAGRLRQKRRISGKLHEAAGREAAIAGVTVDLLPGDALSTSALDAAAGTLKGMPLSALFSQVAGHPGSSKAQRPATQPANADQVSLLPRSSTAAMQLSIACGVALVQKQRAEGSITAAFCGDEEPWFNSWREPLAFAGQNRLPIVFVCQHEPALEQVGAEAQARFAQIADHAKACGIPSITVDGSDVVAVYRVAFESITRARQGRGPTLIECRTHQFQPSHRVPRRNPKPLKTHDPVRDMETYLARKGLFHQKLKDQITRAFRRELNAVTKLLDA